MSESHLFFGFGVDAPWPDEHPMGRIVKNEARHITVAFLGNVELAGVEPLLERMPKPPWKVGAVGILDEILFLPHRHPRVAAFNVSGRNFPDPLLAYQKELVNWLREEGFELDRRDFLPHVTVARAPFHVGEWRAVFYPIPYYTGPLNLYRSLGDSRYEVLWSHAILPPFIEIDHVADIAFHIYGEKEDDIHLHGQIALAFQEPKIIPYLKWIDYQSDVSSIVMELNDIVTKADQEEGLSIKAVSYHGEIQKEKGLFSWEMIVDV